MAYKRYPTPEERESVRADPKHGLRRVRRVRMSTEQLSHEEVVDDAHERQNLHPGRVLGCEAAEIAVGIQELKIRAVVDSGDGVGEGMEEGRDCQVQHEPLGEVSVSLVQDDDSNDGQTAEGGECTNAGADCSHGQVGSRVVRLQAVDSS